MKKTDLKALEILGKMVSDIKEIKNKKILGTKHRSGGLCRDWIYDVNPFGVDFKNDMKRVDENLRFREKLIHDSKLREAIEKWAKSKDLYNSKYENLSTESVLTYDQSKEILEDVSDRDYGMCFIVAKELANNGVSFEKIRNITEKAFR